jgi:Dyp-type peroxidase family
MNAAADNLELDEIQGNILAGFNKDWQAFLFFTLPADVGAARAWLAEIVDDVASTTEVKAFNDVFRLIRKRHRARVGQRGHEGTVEATWMNLAFTHPGLRKLGVEEGELGQFPEDFREGMRARKDRIGDVGDNDPANWPANLGSAEIDVVVIVAADEGHDRERAAARYLRRAFRHGLVLVHQQDGMVREDLPGHEHFGFKDGISQPVVLEDPDPGEDVVAAGEFVLGYPRQGNEPPPPPADQYHPAPPVDDPLNPQPQWTKNGSYFVFRRLRQDVEAFLDFLIAQAPQSQLSVDLLGAKMVGRYRSGAPLEGANNAATDPGTTDPTRLDKDNINNFEYQQNDPDGLQVPRAGHIRKAYPRDQQPPGKEEAERRRIMRRGIPFGRPFHRGGEAESPYASRPEFPHDRGLCFACYQRSIEGQFEFIQQNWVNTADFPQPADGLDPIISQATPDRQFKIPPALDLVAQMKQWVTTTGGEYFFAPSISALKHLASAG